MDIKPNKLDYRKKKISKELIDKILEQIELGVPKKHAAESNLISESFLYYMMRQGICDIDYENYHTLYAYLVQSLRKIEAKEISSCIKDIRKSQKGHKGAQWILEHAYWRQFCGDAKLMELAQEIELEKGKLNHEGLDKERSEQTT